MCECWLVFLLFALKRECLCGLLDRDGESFVMIHGIFVTYALRDALLVKVINCCA